MTSEVAIMNSQGVALAADSAVMLLDNRKPDAALKLKFG